MPGLYIIGALAGYPLIKHCLNQGYEVVEYILGNHIPPADEPLLQDKLDKAGVKMTVTELVADDPRAAAALRLAHAAADPRIPAPFRDPPAPGRAT